MAMPFMVLPSSMPSSGMAYWGVYQGVSPRMTTRANTATVNEDRNMDPVPSA